MIEISISRELADAHPGFMAGCAERGHAVSVFDSDARPRLAKWTAVRRPGAGTTCWASIGDRTPGGTGRPD